MEREIYTRIMPDGPSISPEISEIKSLPSPAKNLTVGAETSDGRPIQRRNKRDLTPERMEQVADAWRNKWRRDETRGQVDPNQRETEKLLLQMGLPPMEGGAIGMPPGGIDPLDRHIDLGERGIVLRDAIKILQDPQFRSRYFDGIFANVDAKPNEFWDRAFNALTDGMKYDNFIDLLNRATTDRLDELPEVATRVTLSGEDIAEIKSDLEMFQKVVQVRKSLHDMQAIIFLPSVQAEDVLDRMQQFSAEFADIALRTPGLQEAMDLYEEVLYEAMARRDGYLKPEDVRGKVKLQTDGRVKVVGEKGWTEQEFYRRFKEARDSGRLIYRDKDGLPYVLTNADVPDAKIDQIFGMTRGMMMIDQRLISIAAESRTPAGSGEYTSLFLQDVIQKWNPFNQLIRKFKIYDWNIAALLYQEGRRRGNVRDTIKDLEKVWRQIESGDEDAYSVLENSLRYITRENPNRAGDLFTWLSWRVGKDKDRDMANATARFINEGRKRQETRRARGVIRPIGTNIEDWDGEYYNWIGTGVRFEKLRGGLAKLDKEHGGSHHGGEVFNEADRILRQMSEVQGHRLYLKSSSIRARLNLALGYPASNLEFSETQQAEMSRTLQAMAKVETYILNHREELLDRGKTFDSLIFNDYIDIVLDDPEERSLTRNFQTAAAQDFKSNREKYWDEFIYNRENAHGYVLWTGDANLREWDFVALGPTGIARRARDNKSAGEAVNEEIKLIGMLRHIRGSDEIVEQMGVIFEKIAAYDSGKARQTIAELAKGIGWFFRENGNSEIPIYGLIQRRFGGNSFAQAVYGKFAPAWSPGELKHFIEDLEHRGYITDEDAHSILKDTKSTQFHAVKHGLSVTAQFAALALALYLAEKVLNSKD